MGSMPLSPRGQGKQVHLKRPSQAAPIMRNRSRSNDEAVVRLVRGLAAKGVRAVQWVKGQVHPDAARSPEGPLSSVSSTKGTRRKVFLGSKALRAFAIGTSQWVAGFTA